MGSGFALALVVRPRETDGIAGIGSMVRPKNTATLWSLPNVCAGEVETVGVQSVPTHAGTEPPPSQVASSAPTNAAV